MPMPGGGSDCVPRPAAGLVPFADGAGAVVAVACARRQVEGASAAQAAAAIRVDFMLLAFPVRAVHWQAKAET
jgi:hypothetical protein